MAKKIPGSSVKLYQRNLVRISGLAGRRTYGPVQSGFLQPVCVWPTRLPLPSVHHHFRIPLMGVSHQLTTLIWILPPAATVPELRLTWSLPSVVCTTANVLAGF